MKSFLNVVIVGCGNIAKKYADDIKRYPHVKLMGFSDLVLERAAVFAKQHEAKAYETLEAVLKDETVDLVVNLTIHHAHAEVIRACLEAGKHVHTEKPFALNYEDAKSLVALAEEKKCRLSSAPINFMGEAQETAWNLLKSGKLGTPRLAYAEVNHGRIETWHPNPEPFYGVGIMWDVGIYQLTLLTSYFGAVTRVSSYAKLLYPNRVTSEGREFVLTTPDFYASMIEFANGTVARLTANFYAKGSKQGGSLEVHGDAGQLHLSHFQDFSAEVQYAKWGEAYETVKPIRAGAPKGSEYGRGIEELADAILNNRPHRAQPQQAAHVVHVLESISQSATEQRPIELASTF